MQHHRSITQTVVGGTALLGAALMPLLASCGGDDRLTEAEFLEKGNAVCAESNARMEEAAATTFADGSPADAAAAQPFLDLIVDEIGGQLDAIGALRPPTDLEGKVDEMLSAVDDALTQMEDDIEADPMGFLESGPSSFEQADALATEIGLVECAG